MFTLFPCQSVVKSKILHCIRLVKQEFVFKKGHNVRMYQRYKRDIERMAASGSPDEEILASQEEEKDPKTIGPDQKRTKTSKSFKSAVVIIPPEDCWEKIQEIRKVHDKGYVRWMPHISMVYPFLADKDEGEVFAAAAEKFKSALSEMKPFKVKLSTFMHFTHKKYSTMWLKPESDDDCVVTYDAPQCIGESATPSDTASLPQGSAASNTPANGAAESTTLETTPSQHTKSKSQLKREAKVGYMEERKKEAGRSKVVEIQPVLEQESAECNDVSVISENGSTPHPSAKEIEDHAGAVTDDASVPKFFEESATTSETSTVTHSSGARNIPANDAGELPALEDTPSQPAKSKKQLKKEARRRLKEEQRKEALRKLGPGHPKVVEVQRILEQQFPECNDVSVISENGFTPHLSVGQFSAKEIEDYATRFGESWKTVEFEVNEVHLISRKDFDDPFHIRQTVKFGR